MKKSWEPLQTGIQEVGTREGRRNSEKKGVDFKKDKEYIIGGGMEPKHRMGMVRDDVSGYVEMEGCVGSIAERSNRAPSFAIPPIG